MELSDWIAAFGILAALVAFVLVVYDSVRESRTAKNPEPRRPRAKAASPGSV